MNIEDINIIIDKNTESTNQTQAFMKELKKHKKQIKNLDQKRLTRNLVSFTHNAFEVFGDNVIGMFSFLIISLIYNY